MAWFYSVRLRTPDGKSCLLGSVRAIPRPSLSMCGQFRDGVLLGPDFDAVRECVPHRLRTAYDKASPWFGDTYVVCDLNRWRRMAHYSRVEKYHGTITLDIYEFTPAALVAA